MRIIVIFLIFVNLCSANEYHFVSIENLIEQEIGRIILPQVYKKLGIAITITPLPGKRAQFQATSGQSDGEIMRIYSYGKENPTTYRVPTPYYRLETMVFIKKNSPIKIKRKEDLSHYSIVKVRGVKHTNNITTGLSNIADVNSTEQAMRLVDEGLVDIALTNTIDGLMALKKLGIDNVVPIDQPLATLDLFHYIHDDHKELIPLVDSMIKEMIANGEMALIIQTAENAVILPAVTDKKTNLN